MELNFEKIIAVLSFFGSVLLILYVIGNYVFNSSAIDKIEKVRGFELRGINLTLILVVIMYLLGVFLGYLLKFGNILISLIVLISLMIPLIKMRNRENPKLFNDSYLTQIIIYYFLPIAIGILGGNDLYMAIQKLKYIPAEAALHFLYMIIMLIGLILFIGCYRYVNFSKNRKVCVKLQDKYLTGILIAETNEEIYIEIEKVVNRVFKSEITRIIQEKTSSNTQVSDIPCESSVCVESED